MVMVMVIVIFLRRGGEGGLIRGGGKEKEKGDGLYIPGLYIPHHLFFESVSPFLDTILPFLRRLRSRTFFFPLRGESERGEAGRGEGRREGGIPCIWHVGSA